MPDRSPAAERDDLIHILTDTIASEGYEVDTETEVEIARLAKLVVARSRFNEEGEPLEDDEETPELDFEDENAQYDWSADEEE